MVALTWLKLAADVKDLTSMKDQPRWVRRLVTVPAVVLAWLLLVVLFPLLLITALVIDALRLGSGIRPTALRLLLFLLTYLTAEVGVVLACLGIWLVSGFGLNTRLMIRAAYSLQAMWANILWDAACAIFKLRVSVEGDENAAPGPLVIFSRHASIIDNILPFQLFRRRHGMDLRYVLKRELVIDPALDIAGHWLPNHFVDRGGGDSDRELEALRSLASGLGRDEGIVIFPEGTRFTASKRERALKALARRGPAMFRKAQGLQHVLPPRPGGALAILEQAAADVVLVAHHGFDGFASVSDIWNGGMVGKQIRVRISRYSYDQIPKGRGERIDWLFGIWAEMDTWLAGMSTTPALADG